MKRERGGSGGMTGSELRRGRDAGKEEDRWETENGSDEKRVGGGAERR